MVKDMAQSGTLPATSGTWLLWSRTASVSENCFPRPTPYRFPGYHTALSACPTFSPTTTAVSPTATCSATLAEPAR